MATRDMISAVLPTHNGRAFLDRSIQSVLAQTHANWELILVDDASTDQTPQKIESWVSGDDRIQAVVLQQNRGLPGALNEGFRRARGEYFTWTSDDNWYHPQAFARMLHVLQQSPQAAIVYADYTRVAEDGTPLGTCGVGPLETLACTNCIGPCFLYRRKVHDVLAGYDEEMFLAEDYDFWLRASNHFRFLPLHQPLYYYRFHRASLTSQKKRAIAEATENALRRWLPRANWLDRTQRAQGCLNWARSAFRNGFNDIARRHMLRAVAISRRPFLYPGSRSLWVDFALGPHMGDRLRFLPTRLRRLFRADRSGAPGVLL